MVLFFVTVVTVLAAAQARLVHDPAHHSAATPAQIKFAIENKYDQTGPGAKEPEYAHKTFKNLEEALLSYIDDPDTKLPEHEREKAYHQLVQKPLNKAPILVTRYKFADKKVFYHEPQTQLGIFDLRGLNPYKTKVIPETYVKKVHLPKQRPLQLTYLKSDEEQFDKYDPNPQYSFSYGVHDRDTGDSKSAHETREGGIVKGYYTVMDADGKQRTVHYTADDKQGFRAIVRRTPTNSHAAP